jgi:hypothetical protein
MLYKSGDVFVANKVNLRDAAIPHKGLVKQLNSLHIINIMFLKAETASN